MKDGIVGSAADEGGSAISERDVHMSNRHAMHTQPEAPRPVIGMNDERGAVRLYLVPYSKQLLSYLELNQNSKD